MSLIAFALAVVKAVPSVDKWLERFLLAYIEWKRQREDELFKEAIQEAIKRRDQRKLESEENSGKPSKREGLRPRRES